jgi:hypothetical protein
LLEAARAADRAEMARNHLRLMAESTYDAELRALLADHLRKLGDPAGADRSDVPFATWPELRVLHEEGTVDLQSHTYSHTMMFVGERVIDFVTPAFAARSLLSRPLAHDGQESRRLTPADLGAPLYELAFIHDLAAAAAIPPIAILLWMILRRRRANPQPDTGFNSDGRAG